MWPDLIIIGGGVSKKAEKFFPLLTPAREVVPAQLRTTPASSARRSPRSSSAL